MRIALLAVLLSSATAVSALQSVTPAAAPDATLQSGIDAYRAGNYAAAVPLLDSAARGYLSNEQMETYVNSGRFDKLGSLETALIYLAISQSRLGNETAARDAILRVMTAERIAPTYGSLRLDPDAAEFETLSARLVPGSPLPPNAQLARARPAPVQTAPVPMPVQTAAAPVTATSSEPSAAERAERERYIEQRLAEERARIERMFEERLASERAVIQQEADERVAAAQRAADQRIAAAQRDTMRVAAPPFPDFMTRRDYLARLREAEGFVASRDYRRATDLWLRLMRSPGVPRDILAEAATGLYRAGAYQDAIDAFRLFGTFGRGEEDLRYYYAVALFEVGRFADAKRELSCALPFIEVTSEVERYRAKIEQAGARADATRGYNSTR